MKKPLKIVLLAGGALLALIAMLAFALVAWAAHDQEQYQLASNPCERACIQDSGGLMGCRDYCASHPLTYGPAVNPPAPPTP